MTRMTAAEDLLVRARREELDPDEERRLELSLNASRELALLYEAGVGFDAEASLLPGDEARTASLVERALRQLDHGASAPGVGNAPAALRTRSGARFFALSVACGALLTVAVASAWQAAEKRWFSAQSAVQRSTRPAPPPASSLAASPSAPARVDSQLSPSTSAPQSAALSTSAGPKPASSPSSKPASSARELFTLGSVARRSGDIEAAIALYEELCAKYPRSVEAEDARLVLGNLRLEQRSPRAALNQFENYGSGALSLEAIWGKAQALRKLESPEERSVLEQVVRDYPSSPYAAAAKKRLQQLSQ